MKNFDEIKRSLDQKAQFYFNRNPSIQSLGIGKDGDGFYIEASVGYETQHILEIKSDIQRDLEKDLIDTKILFVPAEIEDLVLETPEIEKDSIPSPTQAIQPGLSISSSNCVKAGTISGIFQDDENDYVLTCDHILRPLSNCDDYSKYVSVPAFNQNGNPPANVIGEFDRGAINAGIDCATATIKQGVKYKTEIYKLGKSPQQVYSPKIGDKIIKYGQTTKVTHGYVRLLEVRLRRYKNIRDLSFIQISPVNPPSNFCESGDSGAMAMISSRGKATEKSVGILFSSVRLKLKDETYYKESIAIPTQKILNKFNLSFKQKPTTMENANSSVKSLDSVQAASTTEFHPFISLRHATSTEYELHILIPLDGKSDFDYEVSTKYKPNQPLNNDDNEARLNSPKPYHNQAKRTVVKLLLKHGNKAIWHDVLRINKNEVVNDEMVQVIVEQPHQLTDHTNNSAGHYIDADD